MSKPNNNHSIIFVVTNQNTWGRGLTLKAALVGAGVKSIPATPTTKSVQFVIYTGVVKLEATQEELENLLKCWNVDDWGTVHFYRDNVDQKDVEMKDRLFLGWITDSSFTKKQG